MFEGTEYGTDTVITRSGIATIIADYASYKGITVDTSGMAMKEAPDYDSIPAADLEGMTFCYYGKVMTGDQKGNLNPNGQLTREQAATILVRLADAMGHPLPEGTASFADNASISSRDICRFFP